jgi:hypothetical protein
LLARTLVDGSARNRSTVSSRAHQGAIFGGLVAPTLTYFAINYHLGFGIPMLVGTVVGAVSFVFALLLGPETKGKELVPDLMVAPPARPALSIADGG